MKAGDGGRKSEHYKAVALIRVPKGKLAVCYKKNCRHLESLAGGLIWVDSCRSMLDSVGTNLTVSYPLLSSCLPVHSNTVFIDCF